MEYRSHRDSPLSWVGSQASVWNENRREAYTFGCEQEQDTDQRCIVGGQNKRNVILLQKFPHIKRNRSDRFLGDVAIA
jgi:hypothetical protein